MTAASEKSPILLIKDFGQSIWMDNLSRNIIESGELKELISSRDVQGITSNPAIFQKAIAGNKIYDADIEAGSRENKSVMSIYETLVFEDIRKACDVFLPIYEETNGLDGYVSIEVPPNLARDTEGTVKEAKRYYEAIARPNVMIKIPGTPEGLVAVEKVIAEGINVNITLLFSVESYVETAWAYIRGLEALAAAGRDISKIGSVASFFISRIDSNIDGRLDKLIAKTNDPELKEKLAWIKGKVAISNAKIAYQEYKQIIQSDRWKALSAKGAQAQRLLWASTSTKNPEYSDVLYVNELIGRNTVNTLPPTTIEACADHCDIESRIETDLDVAQKAIDGLAEVGISIDEVMAELLEEGIDKFIKPFDSLIESLEAKANQLVPA
ncbi:MAG: transaldolase [Oscillatoria sp. SIO1A7]|nr:transaldolase [Oscillatoria sp. SIO1A7]